MLHDSFIIFYVELTTCFRSSLFCFWWWWQFCF